MDFTGIGPTIVSITVICYLVGMIVHNLYIDNKWIPCIVGITGMVLGVVGWFVVSDFPANDILTALAIGIASGLASTGGDQIFRQLHPSDKGRITWLAHEDDEFGEYNIDNMSEEDDDKDEDYN